MSRIHPCLGILLCCQLLVAHAGQQPPNIVIFVADDLGFADPGFRGSQIDTPTIDSLAREGMVLNRFYVAPICSPTRAALLTGRDPMRLGIAYSVLLPWDNGGLHPSEQLMSESFKAAGYQTAIVGKWHLGHAQAQFTPNAQGFDEFYGHLHTNVGYYPPYSMVGGKDFQRNGQSIEAEGYESYLLADHASKWIKARDKDRPFLLYMPFLAPHEPLQAPQHLVDKYADLEDKRASPRSHGGVLNPLRVLSGVRSRRPLYAAVVEAMDESMGRVMQTLAQERLEDNTIVLFFSDNGATRQPGRGGGDNAPLRGGKAETWEGGIRVVALAKWPDRIPPGSQSNAVISVMDVFPTLAAAANVPITGGYERDGKNQLAVLTGAASQGHQQTLFFASEIPNYGSQNFAAIEGDWKLVQWVEQDPVSTEVRYALFNLQDDPNEYNNLASKHPGRVQKLAKQILNWRASHPINGVRAKLAPPPGWRAPLDWADYPRAAAQLQPQATSSIAPSNVSEILLDRQLKQRGRLIYNCQPNPYIGKLCLGGSG